MSVICLDVLYVIADSSWAEAGVPCKFFSCKRKTCVGTFFDRKIHEMRHRVTHFYVETLVVNLDFRRVGNFFSQTAAVTRTCGLCSACDQFPCGLGVVFHRLGVFDRFCCLDSSQDEFLFQIVAEFHQLTTNEHYHFRLEKANSLPLQLRSCALKSTRIFSIFVKSLKHWIK